MRETDPATSGDPSQAVSGHRPQPQLRGPSPIDDHDAVAALIDTVQGLADDAATGSAMGDWPW